MRPLLATAAVAFAVGGAVPALALIVAAGVIYVARSPDRLLDFVYAAIFCGLGYLAG